MNNGNALERILAKYAGAYVEVAAADIRKLVEQLEAEASAACNALAERHEELMNLRAELSRASATAQEPAATASRTVSEQALPPNLRAVAVVEECNLDGDPFAARIRFMFNPVPEGAELYWSHPDPIPALSAEPSPDAAQGGEQGEVPQEIIDAIVAFDAFLNEPPQDECRRTMREYRHEAYPKWDTLATMLRKRFRMYPYKFAAVENRAPRPSQAGAVAVEDGKADAK